MKTSRIVWLALLLGWIAASACAQSPPKVVQPGAPGTASKTLSPSTKATNPVISPADVEFMRTMIMHHEQAVEMTGLIGQRTSNEELLNLGKRISLSQADEIKFMGKWLEARGEASSMHMSIGQHSHGMALMPGMLTPQQMDELRKAKGPEFDRLFLAGMIQHHRGALVMVKQLFDTAGAGQDAEVFDFATDVDNTQRAEIALMEKMLKEHN